MVEEVVEEVVGVKGLCNHFWLAVKSCSTQESSKNSQNELFQITIRDNDSPILKTIIKNTSFNPF